MAYYFAYGSNLNYTRLYNRCPSAEVVRKGIVEGYQLEFMENNSRRIVANIVEAKNSHVEGVIFYISDEDMKNLDKCEGHPTVYHREEVVVKSLRAKDTKCITYIMPLEFGYTYKSKGYYYNRKYGVPTNEYFNHIYTGYNMWSLTQRSLQNAYANAVKNKGKIVGQADEDL